MLEFRRVQVFENGDRPTCIKNAKIYNNDFLTLGEDTFVRVEYKEHVADRIGERNRGRIAPRSTNCDCKEDNTRYRVRYINTKYILGLE